MTRIEIAINSTQFPPSRRPFHAHHFPPTTKLHRCSNCAELLLSGTDQTIADEEWGLIAEEALALDLALKTLITRAGHVLFGGGERKKRRAQLVAGGGQQTDAFR